jgi:hypothetical protein
LRVDGIEVRFTEAEKKQLLADMAEILRKLAIEENVRPHILLGIARISTAIEQLTKSDALSQARLDEILSEVKKMPSDTRSVFLNLVASGVWGSVTEGVRRLLLQPGS